MTFVEDAEFITRLKNRDTDALAAVFEAYANKIYRLGVRLLADEQQADGVVQNTFLALIEHIDGFEGRSHLGTWLYQVARHECLGRMRKARPQVALDALADEDIMPTHFVDWREVPEAVMTSVEMRREMERAIESLSPALREVFLLRDVEALSIHDTAAALNITEAAVKVRLHRARLALREKLAAYFEEYAHS